jgi:N-acetylglucosamine kinase-like BadF-type ATPase
MIIAIDGGGTKTHVGAFDRQGHLLYETIGTGCNHQSLGVDTYQKVISGLIDQTCQNLNMTLHDIEYVHLGISGADLKEDFDRLNAATKDILNDIPFSLENDAWLILRSGLTHHQGAVCICGTGANAAAVNQDHETAILRSLSYVLGMYGGGLDIARESLHYAFRADELTYYETRLQIEIPKLFGLSSMSEMVSLLYPHNTIDRHQLAQVTALTFRLADEGDPVSIEIVERIGSFLGLETAGVIKQVGMANDHVPVVIGGTVFEKGTHHFIDSMTKHLTQEIPHAYLVRPQYLPMVGGYLRALDHLGIVQDDVIEKNLEEMRIKR